MQANKAITVKFSLQKVEEYLNCANYGRAFAHYILCFQLRADISSRHEDKFVRVTSHWCNELEQRNDIENVRQCYNQALQYFPENVELLNYYAEHYARYNEIKLAMKYFKFAHALQPNHLPSEKNLQSLYSSKVPQWHYRMLNDIHRNGLYKSAIEHTLRQVPKDAVYNIIDIGTGSGLLSLFANCASQELQLRNVNIVAIEECAVMAQVAQKNFFQNKVRVKLIEQLSTDINNERFYNLLITEIFDCCIFGEGVLSTLIHAHKELLVEKAQVLPFSAKLFLFGMECKDLDKKYRFSGDNKCSLNFPKCIKKVHDDPYDAFSINLYNYKQITNVKEIVTVNFNDVNQLSDLFTNENALPEVNLEIVNEGTCHAIVIYFELILDENAKFKISTNPLQQDYCKCWEQGIVYLNHPIITKKTDVLKLRVSATNDKLLVNHINSTNEHENCPCPEITPDALALLNFEHLLLVYEKVVSDLDIESKPIHILELSPLPLFSILVLKKAKLKNVNHEVKATYITCQQNSLFASKLLELNEISEDNVIAFLDNDICTILQSDIKYNYIVYLPMLESGLLNEGFYSNVDLLKNLLTDDGQFLPTNVNLCYQAVGSNYFEECTQALDSNLFDFAIAKRINEYCVTEMRGLSGNYERVALSNIGMNSVYMHEDPEEKVMPLVILKDGVCNGFLYWFECIYFWEGVLTYNSPFTQGAFVLKEEEKVTVKRNTFLQVKIKQHQGLLKIFI